VDPAAHHGAHFDTARETLIRGVAVAFIGTRDGVAAIDFRPQQ